MDHSQKDKNKIKANDSSSSPENPYSEFREEIDRIDKQLLSLLNQRARLAIDIGELKRARNEPVYVPEREEAILKGLQATNDGPLSNSAVLKIFRGIIEQVRSLELERHEKK